MNTALLNEIAALLQSNGVEVTKELVINMAVKGLIDSGYSVAEALDFVLGAGAHSQIANGLYAALNA